MTFAEHMRQCAFEYLKECLEETRGNVSEAARIAGINRSNLYRLAARCGFDLKNPQAKAARIPASQYRQWLVKGPT